MGKKFELGKIYFFFGERYHIIYMCDEQFGEGRITELFSMHNFSSFTEFSSLYRIGDLVPSMIECEIEEECEVQEEPKPMVLKILDYILGPYVGVV